MDKAKLDDEPKSEASSDLNSATTTSNQAESPSDAFETSNGETESLNQSEETVSSSANQFELANEKVNDTEPASVEVPNSISTEDKSADADQFEASTQTDDKSSRVDQSQSANSISTEEKSTVVDQPALDSKQVENKSAAVDQSDAPNSSQPKDDKPAGVDEPDALNSNEAEDKSVVADQSDALDALDAAEHKSAGEFEAPNLENKPEDLDQPQVSTGAKENESKDAHHGEDSNQQPAESEPSCSGHSGRVGESAVESEPNRTQEFRDLNIVDKMCWSLKRMNICKQTRLQQVLMPYLLNPERGDVFLRSTPNYGKKTAYITAALQRINTNSRKIQAVVVCPTDHLARQSTSYARKIGENLKVKIRYITVDDTDTVNCQLIFSTIDTLASLVRVGVDELKQVVLGEHSFQTPVTSSFQ